MRWAGFLIVLVLLGGGCGAVVYRSQQASNDVNGKARAYLGASYSVSDCSDATYARAGAELWKCQVAAGGDAPATWNVAVRGGRVIDASPA